MGRSSRSDAGSDLAQTNIIRREIPKIIQEFQIKTFLDAPCGDFYWMQNTKLGVERYIGIGVDIVDAMIEINKAKFTNYYTEFKTLNLSRDTLPKVDLIFSRDLLVHLNFEDIFKTIANLKKSGASYLLTTTFVDRTHNADLIGLWRTLNLQLAPFSFPQPILLINEGGKEANGEFSDKSLRLWSLKDIILPIEWY